MSLSPTPSLATAIQTATSAIQSIGQRTNQVAETVAAGIQTSPTGDTSADFTSALVQLPSLKLEMGANVAVIRTADAMLEDLLTIARQ